jgi:hypothetical protein
MKKAIIFFLAISAFFGNLSLLYPISETTTSPTFATVPPPLQNAANILLACPQARNLLSEIQKEGPINLAFLPMGSNASNAMWKPDTRQIVINSSKKREIYDLIRSILFEMHNASSKNQFYEINKNAKKGFLSKKAYIRTIEYIEHQNALKTKNMIEWGIKNHYFPKKTRWSVCADFEEHYKLQQQSGHSSFIASVYDYINGEGKKPSVLGTKT